MSLSRKAFLSRLGLGMIGAALLPMTTHASSLQSLHQLADALPHTDRLPALFIGHGSPMNALADNPFTQHLNKLGQELRTQCQIQAIVVVSAHWLTKGTWVQASAKPKTIHDFGGFPEALHQMQYPALGSPLTAKAIHQLVQTIELTEEWGLDHGSWTILHHLWPKADIPVLQISIDFSKPMAYHRELGTLLRTLRSRGVLVIGSGNVVHNLRLSIPRLMSQDSRPFDWALDFDNWVGDRLEDQDFAALERYETIGEAGRLAVPTTDHYLPMLYTVGMAHKGEQVKTTFNEVTHGGMSMRSFRVG